MRVPGDTHTGAHLSCPEQYHLGDCFAALSESASLKQLHYVDIGFISCLGLRLGAGDHGGEGLISGLYRGRAHTGVGGGCH